MRALLLGSNQEDYEGCVCFVFPTADPNLQKHIVLQNKFDFLISAK